MKKIVCILSIFLYLKVNSQAYYENKSSFYNGNYPFSDDKNFEITFEDDFNSSQLNTKWDFRIGPSCSYTPNCVYLTNRPVNARVATIDGKLELNINKENYMGKNYTGALITAKQKIYPNSYIECSAKIPYYGQNACSAFWLWEGNGNCSQNDYREIDIMEQMYLPNHSGTNFSGCIHYCYNNKRDDYCFRSKYYSYQSTSYNTYSAWWGRDKICNYYNQNFTKPCATCSQFPPVNIPTNVFNYEMYLVLQNTLYIEPNLTNVEPGRTNWNFSVDYVKVWHLKEDCNTVVYNIPNFGFNWALKKSYILNNQFLYSIKNYYFHATDVIDLDNMYFYDISDYYFFVDDICN